MYIFIAKELKEILKLSDYYNRRNQAPQHNNFGTYYFKESKYIIFNRALIRKYLLESNGGKNTFLEENEITRDNKVKLKTAIEKIHKFEEGDVLFIHWGGGGAEEKTRKFNEVYVEGFPKAYYYSSTMGEINGVEVYKKLQRLKGGTNDDKEIEKTLQLIINSQDTPYFELEKFLIENLFKDEVEIKGKLFNELKGYLDKETEKEIYQKEEDKIIIHDMYKFKNYVLDKIIEKNGEIYPKLIV